MKNNSIIITGSTGFIGKYLLEYIKTNTDWYIYKIYRKGQIIKDKRIKDIKWDLGKNRKDIIEADYLIHLASYIDYSNKLDIENFKELMNSNVLGLFDILNNTRFKKAVILSSSSVYGRSDSIFVKECDKKKPDTIYGLSKLFQLLLSEYLKANYFKDLVTIKNIVVPSIYGFGQYDKSVLPVFLKRALSNEDIEIFGKGNRSQDFLYVKDLVRILVELVQKNFSGTYNLGSGKETTLIELAKIIIDVTDSKSKILFKKGNFNESRKMLDVELLHKKYPYGLQFKLEDGIKDYINDIRNN